MPDTYIIFMIYNLAMNIEHNFVHLFVQDLRTTALTKATDFAQ